MKRLFSSTYPDSSTRKTINTAAQLWAFAKRINIGDIVVLPLKSSSTVALGKITGNYCYKNDRHTRQVEWIRPDIPRHDFGQDLLYSFGAYMTVCQVRRNNAEERLISMLAGNRDANLSPGGGININDPDNEETQTFIDLEEQGYDQIRMIIESKFKGHNLTRLVEAILKTQGYQTYRSPEGPDGGVDILAGFGPMGFENPRVCVQVKSGGIQNDATLRELEGAMGRMNAQQGLFVSWDGFNKTALEQTRHLFFKVRLWDDKALMTNLLNNYENLPEHIQAELPLKRIWVIVPDEE